MNMRENKSSRWSFNSKFLVTTIVTVIVALIAVAGAQAFEIMDGIFSGGVIRVPSDYSTIQAAVDAASPGEIIQVSQGTYHENVTLNKPVSLVAETFDEVNPANNKTVIDGGGGSTTIFIPPGLTQMPTLRGFVIQNSTNGIQASSPFIAEFNFLQSANTLVSYQEGGGGFNRNNVYFHAGDNAIRLDNMNKPLLIENNRVMYSQNAGFEISLQNTIVPPSMVEVDIWNNMILGNGEDGIQFVDHMGDPQDTNRRFVIAGNLIANNQKAGIGLMPNANTIEDYSGADMAEAVRVFNNTFYGNDYGISGGDNVVAFNNIFTNSITLGSWRVQSTPNANSTVALSSAPANNNSVVAYSLFFGNTVDAAESNLGTGNLMGVDPLFEAAPNPGPDGTWGTLDDDFSGLVLRSDSPAIDKGVTQFTANNGELIPPSPLTGFTGTAPDLGWREFGAPIFPTPTLTPISSFTPLPTETIGPLTPEATLTSVPASPTIETPQPLPTSTPTQEPATATPTQAAVTATPTTGQLTILAINPISAQANTVVTMTINGSGFQEGAVVAFEGGQGLPQEILAIQVVNPEMIIVTMTARNDGTAGIQVWDVRVTNLDGSTIVLEDAFTVVPETQ
jgi:cell division septation protein DedD